MSDKLDEKALEAAIIEGSNIANESLVRKIVTAYLSALRPGSTGVAEVTDAMIEAGHDAACGWTDRYMDGAEFVNWQQGLPDIYRAMLAAAGGENG